MACDNNGAIQRIHHKHTKSQNLHFDYLSAIQQIISELKITIHIQHVEGHKDRVLSSNNLSTIETMNITADTHAKLKATGPLPQHFQREAKIFKEWPPLKIRLENNSTLRIHSRTDHTLYDLLTTQATRKYWIRKMKIPPYAEESINWQSLSSAFTSLPSTKKKEVVKWSSGFCGTNAALYLRKQSTTAECPGCPHQKETTDHIIQCSASGASEV